MVCVTVQKNCERLIREGASLCGDEGLSVVHVVKKGGNVLGADSDGEAMDYLYKIARDYGAEMDVLRAGDITGTLVKFARQNEMRYLVIGESKERTRAGVGAQLQAKLPQVRVFVIP